MSRRLTANEVRDRFIEHIWTMIEYWEKEPAASSERDRLAGFAHSLLVTFDGNGSLPRFTVAPSPHPSDRQYHIDNDEDYYPEAEECVDIAGSLHERLYRWAEEHGIPKE